MPGSILDIKNSNTTVIDSNDEKSDSNDNHYARVDVAINGGCLFSCLAVGMLLPLVDKKEEFSAVCENIFLPGAEIENKEQIKEDIRNMLKVEGETDPDFLSGVYDLLNISFRNVIAQYIKQNQQKYSNFISESITEYLKKVGERDFFGGELEICAFCDMLGLKVIVYNEDEQGQCIPVSKYGPDNVSPIRILHTRSSLELRRQERNHYHLLIEPEYVHAHLAAKNNPSLDITKDLRLRLFEAIIKDTTAETFQALCNLLAPYAGSTTEPFTSDSDVNNSDEASASPRLG